MLHMIRRIVSGAPKPDPGITATFASVNNAVAKSSTFAKPVFSNASDTSGK